MSIVTGESVLDGLKQVENLMIVQKLDNLELRTGHEIANRYQIMTFGNLQLFYAVEMTGDCNRWCCGAARPFQMKVLDAHGRHAMQFIRPCRPCCCWDACCCWCVTGSPGCRNTVEVQSPPGTTIGYVKQKCAVLCRPSFAVQDAQERTQLRVVGDCCPSDCCGSAKFKVMSVDGEHQVGQITKRWSGFTQEAYANADKYGITFPGDLAVKVKAVLLAATILVDFIFFEERHSAVDRETFAEDVQNRHEDIH